MERLWWTNEEYNQDIIAIKSAFIFFNVTMSAVLDWKTHIKKWDGKPSRIDHLRVFGCHLEVLITSVRR